MARTIPAILIRYLLCLMGPCLLLWADNALAFKVDTHIWIAQQIITQLAGASDGKIQLQLGDRSFPVVVPAQVRHAILQNPEYYRMGSVGPDALPGIYEGQMSIHPGAKWGTGEWLEHILKMAQTDQEIAFAYGMIAHAAADVWAHSYVNHYAGDVYWLTDGETHVEARHFLLEGYISEHLPTYLSSSQQTAFSLVKTNGGYAIPADFLYKTFVDSAEASDQFAESGSIHMAAIRRLNNNLLDIAEEDGPADQLHRAIQKIVIERYTGYNARNEELKEINKAHQKFKDIENASIDELQKHHDGFRAAVRKGILKVNKKSEALLAKADNELDKLSKVVGKLHSVEQDLVALNAKLEKYIGLRPPPHIRIYHRCLKRWRGQCVFWDPVPSKMTIVREHPHEAPLRDAIELKVALERRVLKEERATRKRFREFVGQAHKTAISIYDTETTILKSAIDLGQSFNSDENPIKGVLLQWVAANKKAMIAYFRANAEAIENTLIHHSPLKPLTDWLNCEALTFLGVPSDGLKAGCAVKNSIGEIKALLDGAQKIDPGSALIEELRKKIIKMVMSAVQDKALDFTDQILGTDLNNLFEAMTTTPNANNLDRQFMKVPASKALLKIENLASRVDAEMDLTTSGHFNPATYAVIYNAITMVQLSLLDGNGLNQMIGQNLFSVEDLASNNIMMRFARSIDGDYQWMPVSPRYARSDEKLTKSDLYGYSQGFALWKDPIIRNDVFRKLFKGPLNVGLDMDPSPLPLTYPFRPSPDCPFPNDPDGDECK